MTIEFAPASNISLWRVPNINSLPPATIIRSAFGMASLVSFMRESASSTLREV